MFENVEFVDRYTGSPYGYPTAFTFCRPCGGRCGTCKHRIAKERNWEHEGAEVPSCVLHEPQEGA